jgi:hypothetical protein
LAINSSTYNWTYAPGAHASLIGFKVNLGATTANPNVTFPQPISGSSSTWTISLSATDTVSSAGGTQIKSTASASPVTITVTALPPSVNITELLGADGTAFTPNANGFIDATSPTNYTVVGLVAGASGILNTTFTVAQCADATAACTSPGPATALTTTNAGTTTPSASLAGLFIQTYYKITMSTTANGSTFGQASAVVLLDFLL